ncbi:MAG: T9SS type A sorting domain-containing protein [Flavobacteriales bacterium]|nr:T9SS type A sorting domain-containing protein [Flavobacteriales bacterium]
MKGKLLLTIGTLFLNCLSAQITHINENFSGTGTPLGWTNTAISGNLTWNFGIDGSSGLIGNNNLNNSSMAFFDDDAAAGSQLNNTIELKTPAFDNSNMNFSYLLFKYNFKDASAIMDAFTVEVFDGSRWNTVLTETTDNCGSWNSACPGGFPQAKIDISAYKNTNCQVRFTYHDGNDWAWYVGLDDVTIISDTLRSIPYFIDFESIGNPGHQLSYSNGFTTISSGMYHWGTGDGTNATGITGPSKDHTLGTSAGTLMFTDASLGNTGDQTILVSPLINIGNFTNLNISYWYHMFGFSMGNLSLEVSYGSNWIAIDSLLGEDINQSTGSHSAWKQRTIALRPPLGSTTLQYRFRGIRGGRFSNMAIDDVLIQKNTITSIEEKPIKELSFNLHPNPSNGLFTITQNSIKENISYKISSILGSIVKKGTLDKLTQQIDLSNQPSGVYFLTLRGINQTKKIIIR